MHIPNYVALTNGISHDAHAGAQTTYGSWSFYGVPQGRKKNLAAEGRVYSELYLTNTVRNYDFYHQNDCTKKHFQGQCILN